MNAIPDKYLGALKGPNRRKQLELLLRSQVAYRNGKYLNRPKFKSHRTRKSSFVTRFKKRYGISSMKDKNAIFKATGVPANVQESIVAKGKAAFYSSGARPSQTASSWGLARLAAVLIGGKACNIDKHLLSRGINCKSLKVKSALRTQ
jgi:hypothetical protein